MYFIKPIRSVVFILQLICSTQVIFIVSADNPKIAIIGAGIGGSSCAYFLREYLNFSVDIDVFEANKIGGRLSVVEYEGSTYEVGGTIIHGKNRYMNHFLKALKLSVNHDVDDSDSVTVIRDENGIEFESSKWKIKTFFRMLWRYNFLSLYRLERFVSNMLIDFDRIYKFQSEGKCFTTVEELFSEADSKFLSYFNTNTEKGFAKFAKVNKITVNDLVRGSLRVNYGQTTNVHTFVGSVSVAGMFGPLWSVAGGNKQIPELLLIHSYSNFIPRTVTKIVLDLKTDRYIVESVDKDQEIFNQVYDIVVLAAPITNDAKVPIKFVNFPKPIEVQGKYHRTVATIVEGILNINYFGITGQHSPQLIINNNVKEVINSIGKISPCSYNKNYSNNVWKIFSRRILTESEMDKIFLKHKPPLTIDWLAYPHYEDLHLHRSFILHDKLYHINAIEWAASAMEMSAIGAKNVALLINHQLKKKGNFNVRSENSDSTDNRLEL